MTYLMEKKEIESLWQNCHETISVQVISDMPLQPWLELALQKSWAQRGKKAAIQRISWEERHTAEGAPQGAKSCCLIWPSSEAWREVGPELGADGICWPDGIWIGPEHLSDPVQRFYGALWQDKRAKPTLPASSRLLDLEKILAEIGLEKGLAGKEESRWGDQYSRALQEQAAEQVVRLHEALFGRRKKCVVLDCDGVLWGGVVSEDGLGQLQLAETGAGRAYYAFQKLLGQLTQHGMLLAICSKNDEADVRQVFREHTAMVLKEEQIAAWSVCWRPKSEQMVSLSEKLKIDLQDMVLVDDSEWEIAEVQAAYPQVAGVHFRPETAAWELARWIRLLPEDQNEQNRLRVQTYQDDQKREALRQKAGSYEEFLKQLGTQVTVQEAGPSDLARISDLSRRANRCTNGVRYSQEELWERTRQGYRLRAVFVKDIYRDLGLVGCIGIDAEKKQLDLFCLSCRAMGRRLEEQLIQQLDGAESLRWKDTGKNSWLKELFQKSKGWKV